MAGKSKKSPSEIRKAFKKKIDEAKVIWNNPKKKKSIKTFADAVKQAYKFADAVKQAYKK